MLALVASACSSNAVEVGPRERSEYSISRYEAEPVNGKIIHAIGIYEGGSGHSADHQPRADVTIEITDQGDRPVYLALASYQPVRWNVTGPGRVAVKAVYIDGFNKHEIAGIDRGRVINRSGQAQQSDGWGDQSQVGGGGWSGFPQRVSCPYTYGQSSGGGCESATVFLKNAEMLLRAPVASFTGVYNAQHFTIHAVPEL